MDSMLRKPLNGGDYPLAVQVAATLFINGQTTEAVGLCIERLGKALGRSMTITARWGELTLLSDGYVLGAQVEAQPLGVDIGRIVATQRIVDQLCDGTLVSDEAARKVVAVGDTPPVSLVRFAIMAGAGAAALSVIFGATDLLTILVIVASAGLGACLRRAVSNRSSNAFAQPFLSALLAGAIAGVATALEWPVSHRLVSVCPCMILVPGPHFLNGMIDLARARVSLGAARVAFATLVVLAISAGLLAGLSFAITGLPEARSTPAVPFAYDICAAGLAVAAYGSFFNMPWRMLPVPIAIGMLAHALRWELTQAGVSPQAGVFFACSLVGAAMPPIADRLRLPFGASAFAAVVSLIPGVFMFQTASEVLAVVNGRPNLSPSSLLGVVRDGTTALIMLMAMGSGLILPKLVHDHRKSLSS